MPHGTVSYHFASKQALLVEAALDVVERSFPLEEERSAGTLADLVSLMRSWVATTSAVDRVGVGALMEAMREAGRDPGVRDRLLGLLATNPLWRRLTTHPDELQAVARRLDPDRVAGMAHNAATALIEFIIAKRDRGELINVDPPVIMGVLQTVLMVPLHAERVGDPATYPKILDLLIDIVAAGLTPRNEPP